MQSVSTNTIYLRPFNENQSQNTKPRKHVCRRSELEYINHTQYRNNITYYNW